MLLYLLATWYLTLSRLLEYEVGEIYMSFVEIYSDDMIKNLYDEV